MKDRFHGIGRSYGMRALPALAESSVMVIGVGGVGSWAAEALARTGVGALTLVDLDDICVSNINRQVLALNSTVGQLKVEALGKRLLDIHPELRLTTDASFMGPKNMSALLAQKPTVIVDCTDDAQNKCLLAASCRQHGQLLVTVGASGGRRDPSRVTSSDLSQTRNDRLLYRVRKLLRQDYAFPREHEGEFGIACVYSNERPVYPTEDGCLSFEPQAPGQGMDCASGYGSVSFVTGTFGFHAAALAVKLILERRQIPWV